MMASILHVCFSSESSVLGDWNACLKSRNPGFRAETYRILR